jgi:ADP-ribose pyrophosphatase YjhB (NUDIX family)
MRGVWTLPGGLVEAGETLAEAALRELTEEVGITAEVVGVLSPTEIIVRDEAGRARHHYVVHPHAALWCGGEPVAGPEALGVRWAALDEIAGLETTPGLIGTLREAFARLDARGMA